MKKFILATAIISAGVVIFSIGASAQGIKEGKWSLTIVTKMAGMEQQTA